MENLKQFIINHSEETLIEGDEGLRLKPYKDTKDHWTLGYGHNLDAQPLSTPQLQFMGNPDIWKDGITKEAALWLLDYDIEQTLNLLKAHVSFSQLLDEVRQAVLVDMCFNMGVCGLLKFHKMLSFVQAGDYSGAANEMGNSEWAFEVPNRAKELMAMMRTGQWNNEGGDIHDEIHT